VSRGGADVVVRLNRPMRMTVRDLEAVIGRGAGGRAAESGKRGSCPARRRDHRRTRSRARHRDRHDQDAGHGRDSRRVLSHSRDRKASPRLVALNLGAEDFALSAGMLPEADGLFMPKQVCVFAARAAGIMPLGFVGTVANFTTSTAFARQCAARAASAFWAPVSFTRPRSRSSTRSSGRAPRDRPCKRVVAAYDKALAEGIGAVTVDGKMIDVPVVERAKLLLEREAAIAAREERAGGWPAPA